MNRREFLIWVAESAGITLAAWELTVAEAFMGVDKKRAKRVKRKTGKSMIGTESPFTVIDTTDYPEWKVNDVAMLTSVANERGDLYKILKVTHNGHT